MNPPAPLPPRIAHNKRLYDAWMQSHGIDPRIPLLQAEWLPVATTDPIAIIDLPNVTLWSSMLCSDNRTYLARVVRVLRYMNRFCKFKATRLLSHLDPGPSFELEWVKVEKVPSDQLSAFLNQVAPQYLLDSDFSFSVHEDGFIIYPDMWDAEFLNWDYIGGPWPTKDRKGCNGNGGFCLESKKMNEAKLALPKDTSNPLIYADQYICVTHRTQLEEQGIRFAPVSLAGKFSVELTSRTKKSFGFHGKGACPLRYIQGWKNIEESEQTNKPELIVQKRTANHPMKVVLIYLHVLTKCDPTYVEPTPYAVGAKRFADSYRKFKPSIPHHFITVNAGDQSKLDHDFDDITNENIPYNGTGWDCGTYQDIAGKLDCDLVVCFNTLSYLWRPGWLEPIVNAAHKYKKGVFGLTSSNDVNPHLRTPCIAFHPDVIREYPLKVVDRVTACYFEHGPNNFSKWAISKGYPSILVTPDGEYLKCDWRKPANIFRRGDQTNCLVWDRHTLIYANSDPTIRKKLESDADNVANQSAPVYIENTKII